MKLNLLSQVRVTQPLQLVQRIVAHHRKNAPDLKMRMAIWLNPANEMLYPWQHGVELIEICENVALDLEPEFRATQFAPQGGLPGLRLILTSPGELNLDLELAGNASYFRRLQSRLRNGKAVIVFPRENKPAEQMLEELLGPVTA